MKRIALIALIIAFPLTASAMSDKKMNHRLTMLEGQPVQTAIKLWGVPSEQQESFGVSLVTWSGQGCKITLTLDKNLLIVASGMKTTAMIGTFGFGCASYFKNPWFEEQKRKE